MKKLLYLSFTILTISCFAQDPLEVEILKLDSIIFQEGFNNCNMDVYPNVLAEDLEFYHDQGGITNGRATFIEVAEKNLCTLDYRPIRKLLPETTAVFPLKNNGILYGAIQMGTHEFYAEEEGKAPYKTSIAEFTHLWLMVDEQWKLKRVLSYNHRDP